MNQRKIGGMSLQDVGRFVTGSYKKKKDVNEVNGATLDRSLSTKRSKVYVKDGKATVVHSGTDSASDWLNNPLTLVPALYRKTDRYRKAEAVQRSANKKYGRDNVDAVGHSQSGMIVNELAKKNIVKKATVLNPAIIGRHSGKVKVIRSSGDVVSAFTKKQEGDKTIKAKTYNPLTEHSASILGGKKYITPHSQNLMYQFH
jgi:hypothetical protein